MPDQRLEERRGVPADQQARFANDVRHRGAVTAWVSVALVTIPAAEFTELAGSE
jgi:hypothetical protein